MFWRRPYYMTRCTGICPRAVQNPGDIVRLTIVLSGVLLRICSLPVRRPPRRGALDMCGTARIFRLEHNICIKSTSTRLNPGRSAAYAQHPRRALSHSFIASGWKESTKSWTSEFPEIWNPGHTYSNSYILLNFHTNESFTIQELLRSSWSLLARILELLQHSLKTFLNFENSLRFENLFKTKSR